MFSFSFTNCCFYKRNIYGVCINWPQIVCSIKNVDNCRWRTWVVRSSKTGASPTTRVRTPNPDRSPVFRWETKCVCSLCIERLYFQRSLPAYARVKQSRVPNAYDKTALRLEVTNLSYFHLTVATLTKPSLIPASTVPAGDDDPPLLSSDLILFTTTTITRIINRDQMQNIRRQCFISAHPRLVTLSRWPRCQ